MIAEGMTAIFFVATLLCTAAMPQWVVAAANATPQLGLLDCDIGKVALFDDTASKDGRYALGWTIRVPNKGAKPVDWSLWTHEDHTGAMRDNYILNFNNDPNFPYDYDDYAVDLKKKKTVELPGADFFLGRPRCSLNAYWGPDLGMPVYGLAQSQSRFATDNLLLIRIDKTGMSAIDLVKPLDEALHKILETKMPLTVNLYAISYPKSDWDEHYTLPTFHATTVDIPFAAELPKSDFDMVTGTVTVHLPDGGLLEISSDAARDDPFRDDPALAKADHELNAVHAELQRQLDPARSAALKDEQRAWIGKRDSDAGVENYPIYGQELDPSTVRHDRNESLLKSTLLRIKELKNRIGSTAPHSN